MSPENGAEPVPAAVRIVGGSPTVEETAVVVSLLAVLSDAGGGGLGGAPRRSLWASRARNARPRLSPGPGAWRGSSLPR